MKRRHRQVFKPCRRKARKRELFSSRGTGDAFGVQFAGSLRVGSALPRAPGSRPSSLVFFPGYGTYRLSETPRLRTRLVMRRQIFLAATLLLFALVSASDAGAAVIEQLIAVINGEPYTMTNLNRYA